MGLYVVADGIACSNNGELAAHIVTHALPAYLLRHLDPSDIGDSDAATRLGRAVADVSDELFALGRNDLRVTGTGTTVVAALVSPSRAVIAHLGDSRAYLYRDDTLERLTADHNLIEALVHAGEVSAAEAAVHPGRNMLTRHVAMPPPALPDTRAVDLQPGDRILLCSDGLHGVVDGTVISEVLDIRSDPGEACDALVGAANGAGGPDNITVVVIDIPSGCDTNAGQIDEVS